jgi:outer membrane protein TolC
VKIRSNPRRHLIRFANGAALAALFPWASLFAQISLSTAVDLAQRNSSAVKIAQADLGKAAATLSETKDVYIPNFVIGASIGPPSIGFPTGQPSVANANIQSLAYSAQQGQYIRAARVGIEAASLNLKDAREQVALDASTDYIELDTVQREIDAGLELQTFADRLLTIEQQRQEAGFDPLSEVLQARLAGAELKLKLMHLQARATVLVSQLVALTGLPSASLKTDPASIPAIPEVKADQAAILTSGIRAAQAEAQSHQFQAKGDELANKIRPLVAFGAIYNRDATSLNNYNLYFGRINPKTGQEEKLKADNFSAGVSITIPLFDMNHRAKAQESRAQALRSTVEAEQAQRQNDVQIATLTGNIRELDAQAEVASLKQQIAGEQLKSVEAQLQLGNGAGSEPGAQPQLSPKAEQQARIDERQKSIEAIDAGFDLTKARLSLLRALGHMEDWLREVLPNVQTQATATQ